MRHRHHGKTLGRERAARQALMVHLAQTFVRSGHVTTTLAKAKFARPAIERLITIAKNPSLAARRQLTARLHDGMLVNRLLKDIGPKFAHRPGGYTRIIKLGTRAGDRAPLARLESVE